MGGVLCVMRVSLTNSDAGGSATLAVNPAAGASTDMVVDPGTGCSRLSAMADDVGCPVSTIIIGAGGFERRLAPDDDYHLCSN